MISVPLGITTAIYIAEIAGKRTAEIVKPFVEILASLPSVVIGLFGLMVFGPFLQKVFNVPIGINLFNASHSYRVCFREPSRRLTTSTEARLPVGV